MVASRRDGTAIFEIQSKRSALPAALAKRAERAATGKLRRIVEEAKRDIALIQRRRAEITEAFYDVGEALVRLKRREVVAAMGCKSFAELCEKHVGMSASQADRLVDIVTNMTREEALAVGATKAASLVALKRATPEDDTVADLLRGGVRVGGKAVDVKKASARAVERATKATRARSKAVSKGGRSITKEERATCASLAKALRAAGAKDARVEVKAGKVTGKARAVIELAVEDIARLAQAVKVVRR